MNYHRNKNVNYQHIGSIEYQQGWDYQTELFDAIVATKIANRKLPNEKQKPTNNYLLFCQHSHVYTLGKSGNEKHLLLDQEALKSKNATFHKINRGGDITYHGPGQLVAYPILDLENFFTDIHLYLRKLEEAVILTLEQYQIKANRIKGLTGVWLDTEKSNPRKICAMGVKTSRWVTMHGLALNINTQLDYFSNIVPCGIEDKAVTSLSNELGMTIDMSEVEEHLKNNISKIFGMKYIEI